MKTAWMPIVREIILLVIAVLAFLVLYDYLVKKKGLKESLIERIFLLFDSLGWVTYFIGIIVALFLVYSIFFE